MSRIVVEDRWYSSSPVPPKPCSDGTHRWPFSATRYCLCGAFEVYRDAMCVLIWQPAEPDVKGRIYQGSPEWNAEITHA